MTSTAPAAAAGYRIRSRICSRVSFPDFFPGVVADGHRPSW
jgi:hypothetical protein